MVSSFDSTQRHRLKCASLVPFECTIDDLAAGWQTSVQYDIGDVYGWSEGLDGVERPVYADDRIVDLLSGGRSVLLQSQAGETEIVNVTMCGYLPS
jgi:hypothetical protein